MATVADLYTSVLGRDPAGDPAGLAYWESIFGPSVDTTELGTFLSVANVTEPTAAVKAATANPQAVFSAIDSTPAPSAPAAVAAPSAATPAALTVEDLYKKFYGTVDPAGAAYWKQQFGSSVDPLEQAKFIKEVANNDPNVNTGVTVEQAFKTYLGGNTDQAGIDYWKSQLGTGQLNAGQLAQLTNRQYGLMDEGGGLFGGGGFLGTGLSTSDLAKAAALYYGGTALANSLGAGAAGAGAAAADASFIAADAAQLAAQGLSQAAIEQNLIAAGVDSFLAADAAQLALQGIGQDQMTGLLTQSAGGTSMFVPSAIGAGTAGAATTGTTAGTGTGAGTGVGTGVGTGTLTGGLTGTDLTTLTKAGLTAAGLLGGTKAISGLTGGTGGVTLPVQDRSGVSSGTAQYSPEYYQAIQAKYNQMMPQQPRDVTTELKNWYETKYAPSVNTPKVA